MCDFPTSSARPSALLPEPLLCRFAVRYYGHGHRVGSRLLHRRQVLPDYHQALSGSELIYVHPQSSFIGDDPYSLRTEHRIPQVFESFSEKENYSKSLVCQT